MGRRQGCGTRGVPDHLADLQPEPPLGLLLGHEARRVLGIQAVRHPPRRGEGRVPLRGLRPVPCRGSEYPGPAQRGAPSPPHLLEEQGAGLQALSVSTVGPYMYMCMYIYAWLKTGAGSTKNQVARVR